MQDFVNIQNQEKPDQPAQAQPAHSLTPSAGLAQADGPGSETGGAKPAGQLARGIEVTPLALEKIRSGMHKEGISPEQGGLRLGILGGGCSGLSYSIRFDTHPRERDRVYEFDGVRLFVDPKSFVYLHGMTLDYEVSLMKQGFNFINPNAKRPCGCGTSFS